MKGRTSKLSRGKNSIVWITMSFTVLAYGLFMIFPILCGIVVSFFNWNPFKSQFKFVGLENYQYILQKGDFWQSIINTLVYTVGTMVLTVGFSLLLAAILQNLKRGVGFYRGMYFLPVVSSSVATAMLWKFMYNYHDGFFNGILVSLGLERVPWLTDARIAMVAIIIMSAWKDIGYAMVLILAGMNDIDRSIYESAEIDGCGKVRQFFRITLPLLRNTMTIVIITRIIDYMQVYTPVKFITSGGPGKATQTMAFYVYEEAFTYYNFGSASAVSMVLFAIIFIISMVQMRVTQGKEN